MKKTSLYLEEHLDEALALRAAEEGVTKAEFIRRTLAGAVERPSRPRPRSVAVFDSRDAGASASVPDTLARTGFGA